MAAALALEDLLPVEHPGLVVLSLRGFAEVRPFLPARVVALVQSQLQVFHEQVVRPVMRATSVEDAQAAFEARMDVVGTVRLCLNRALADSMSHSEQLRHVVANASREMASRTKGAAYQVMGRPHGTLLLSTLRRSSVFDHEWFDMVETWSKEGARTSLVAALLRPEYPEVAALARTLAGLLLVCAMALEDDADLLGLPHARPLMQGLVEHLWDVGLRHNRLGIEWMLRAIQAARPLSNETHALHERLHQLVSPVWLFRELADEWRSATGHLSIPQRIVGYPAYRQLLAMKWDAVPFILGELSHDLERGHGPWFWGPVLTHITGEEPGYDPGEDETVEGVAAAWLRLAQRRGWTVLRAEGLDDVA